MHLLLSTSKRAIVVWSVVATGLVLAAEPRPVLHGRWTATAGPAVLRGIWSAQALPSSANAVVGSWALLNDDGEVTLQGTWTARRSPPGWRGAWRAQVKPTGGSFAGSWPAALPPEVQGKTFQDLLREAG